MILQIRTFLLNNKSKHSKANIYVYDDQILLEVDDMDSLLRVGLAIVEQLRSLGKLVRVGVVHCAVDHLHLGQNDHGYIHYNQLISLDVRPLLYGEVDHPYGYAVIVTVHDGYLTLVGSDGNPPDHIFLQSWAID